MLFVCVLHVKNIWGGVRGSFLINQENQTVQVQFLIQVVMADPTHVNTRAHGSY